MNEIKVEPNKYYKEKSKKATYIIQTDDHNVYDIKYIISGSKIAYTHKRKSLYTNIEAYNSNPHNVVELSEAEFLLELL